MDGMEELVADNVGSSARKAITTHVYKGGKPPGERLLAAECIGPVDRHCGCGEAFAELTLLLPNRQLEELERTAFSRGRTTGQMLRWLIQNGLAGLDDTLPPEDTSSLEAEAAGCMADLSGDSAN